MNKFYSMAAVAAMAMTSFGMMAQDEGAVYSFDPALGEVAEFPAEFTITVDGPASLKKNALVSNPVRILMPGANPQTDWKQCSGTFSGNTVTIKTNSQVDRNIVGDYIVEVRAGGIQYVWEDGKTTKSTLQTYTYTVVSGAGGEDPDDPKDDSVKHDIEITKTIPNILTAPFDVSSRTFETLQLQVNCGDVKPLEDAVATIVGPSYNFTVPLLYNMGSFDGKSTNLKAMFPKDPTYNGEYVLTIAADSFGDPAWIENHEKGRTNAAIEIKFEVEGGKPIEEMKEDLSFSPASVNPTPNSVVQSLGSVSMTFPSKVYFAEGAEMKVGYKADPQYTAFSSYGVATVERVSDTEVKLVLVPAPKGNGEYRITLEKGAFWNEAHELDAEAGAICDELPYAWTYNAPIVDVKITSTVPAAESMLSEISEVVVNTNNNPEVAKMTISIEDYELENDSYFAYLLNETESTLKNEEGAICWKAETPLALRENHYYTLIISLYNENGGLLADKMFDIYGTASVGVGSIEVEEGEKAIYNMQGIRINRSADELPAGLYIIGGKKVIVK